MNHMEFQGECTELFSSASSQKPFSSPITEFLFVSLALSVGAFFSMFVVSAFMAFKPDDVPEESDEESEEDPNANYEYKYTEIFEELTAKDEKPALTVEEKIELKKSVITESTPNGNVVMTYFYNQKNPESSLFQYYCNDRSIPFKYLDTVARKYVITYNCPELYIYLKTELMKEVEKIKQDEEKAKEEVNKKEEETKKEESVFATFKKYKVDNPKEKKAKRRPLLIGKNRYTRLGNIEDYEISLLPKKEVDVKAISFSEYKQKMLSSN